MISRRIVPCQALVAVCLPLCLMLQTPSRALAQSQFQKLVARVPHSANALTILNVEKAKQSPTGQKEGLAEKLDKAFREGLIRVPPSTSRFVLAAELDMEFMSPIWEATVMDLAQPPAMNLIVKAYRAEPDTIEGLSALVLPQDAYVLKLGDNTLGAMSPANRQAVVRWAKEMKSASAPKLSPYLEKAAGYSDRAGTEIIMALDLEGAISPQRIDAYLRKVTWLPEAKVDVAKLKQLLASLEGVRIGVRLGEPANGRLTLDFKEAPVLAPASAKRLFLDLLAEKGLLIDDLAEWQPEVQGTTISLSGKMSTPGIRKLLSVIESPAPAADSAESSSASPATTTPATTAQTTAAPASAAADPAAKTKAYFKNVSGMFDDLKDDMKDAKNLASTSLFFDKYARRIERLPLLDVDPEMLDYGAYVAAQLRQSSGAVRTMGIRTGVRTNEINSSNTGSGSDYYYGGYGYGRYGGTAGIMNDLKAVELQQGVVRAQEKGNMATSVHEIRANVIAATSDVRRKMTEKYRVQF